MSDEHVSKVIDLSFERMRRANLLGKVKAGKEMVDAICDELLISLLDISELGLGASPAAIEALNGISGQQFEHLLQLRARLTQDKGDL